MTAREELIEHLDATHDDDLAGELVDNWLVLRAELVRLRRWEALARQLGEALEAARRWPSSWPQVAAALSVYQDAIKEDDG